jgi:hypothetical protein
LAKIAKKTENFFITEQKLLNPFQTGCLYPEKLGWIKNGTNREESNICRRYKLVMWQQCKNSHNLLVCEKKLKTFKFCLFSYKIRQFM